MDGDNEPVTQRNGMHACPAGYVVTGINVDKNYLLCGYVLYSSEQNKEQHQTQRRITKLLEVPYDFREAELSLTPISIDLHYLSFRYRGWTFRRKS